MVCLVLAIKSPLGVFNALPQENLEQQLDGSLPLQADFSLVNTLLAKRPFLVLGEFPTKLARFFDRDFDLPQGQPERVVRLASDYAAGRPIRPFDGREVEGVLVSVESGPIGEARDGSPPFFERLSGKRTTRNRPFPACPKCPGRRLPFTLTWVLPSGPVVRSKTTPSTCTRSVLFVAVFLVTRA